MGLWPEYPRSAEHQPAKRLVFADDFDSESLDLQRWSPYYLPHWTGNGLKKAHYAIQESRLILSIEAEQMPWCPEYDGGVCVSALQTGHFAGPVGSSIGQHRFKPELVVRQAHENQRLFTPCKGEIRIRVRAQLQKSDLISLYLIGYEELPENSGEITVFEIFGKNVDKNGVVIGRGIKKINDERLKTEFTESVFSLDLSEWHEYSMDWTDNGIRFFLDGKEIGMTNQSPNYPMQLMLTCYRLDRHPETGSSPVLEVDYVRAYEPVPPN